MLRKVDSRSCKNASRYGLKAKAINHMYNLGQTHESKEMPYFAFLRLVFLLFWLL